MSQHHPAPEILTEYARGALHAGAMLVVACHVESCAVCRSEVTLWEGVGGALLEATPLAALSDGALDRMLARLDDVEPQAETPTIPDYLKDIALPAPLAACKIGRRRRVTPSIWFAPVEIPSQGNARTYLVCAGAGTKLSEHTHAGREFTQVLTGAFADVSGIYARGDFACTDDTILHTPTVTPDGECLCLISTDAPMRLTGWPARVIQSLTGTLY
ncbi:MAG TPA: ChrR family anti-sigma-E factor [Rhizomicrobium sp.]|jgi:putative transcriptional regulator